jgi:hypothetical protein
MTGVVSFSASDVHPDREIALEYQGIPPGRAVPPHIEQLYDAALGLLLKAVEPVAVVSEISKDDFAVVFEGEGNNAPSTPVGDVFPLASNLFLFAVTLGEQVSDVVRRCFETNEFAAGSMVDAAASVAADTAADVIERRIAEELRADGGATAYTGVLRYSPGYCGWHVSGQQKLFDYLGPGKIGVTLGASYLMQPLKSVSGVVIAAPKKVHSFAPSYDFCRQCETRSCRERIRALLAG